MKQNPPSRLGRLLNLAAILILALVALAPHSGFAAAAESAAPQGGITCQVYQPGPDIGKDAFIDQEKPDDRKGATNELRVKSEANKLKRSLLQFDLSTLPSDAVISSATLSLYVKGASGGAVTINAHKVTASWKENEVTWKARDKAGGLLWAAQGGDYNATIVSSATLDDTKNVWRAWNLTTLVADWVANPTNNFGVILAAADGKAEKVFKSSEDGTALQRPKLEVCYTAGLTLEPDNSADGVAGLTRTYSHTVRVGNLSTAVTLTAVSDRGWTTRIYKDVDGDGVKDPEDLLIAATPIIGPNADYPILVQVDVPLSAAAGTVDTTTVTATAQTGGGGGGGSGNATAVFSQSLVTSAASALGAPDGTVAKVNAGPSVCASPCGTSGYIVLDLGSTLAAGTTVTIRMKESHSAGAGGQVADVDAGTNGTTFTGLSTFTPTSSLANYTYTIPAGGARYLRIRARAVTGNPADQNIDVDAVSFTGGSAGASATDTAVNRTRVGRQISVSPNRSNYATAGSGLFYGHTITNNGDQRDCMTVTATSSQGWTVFLWQDLNRNAVHETVNPAEPALSNPVCLEPGATYWLVAEVRVPAGAATGTVDQTVIRAVSGNDPSKSGSAVDTTEVFVNNPPVIDGKYDNIYTISPDAEQVCYTSNGTLFGKLATFYQPTADAVYMVLAIDKDFVDNTYGTNAIGWPGGHTFGNLTGSDHAQFQGFDATGKLVLDIKQDYLTSTPITPATPSGYDSLGVTGGDGKVILGSAANIKEWATSLDYNLNATGYCAGGLCNSLGTDLEINSPKTDAFYTPNATYPAWIYDVIYEIKIDKAAFGAAGFGSIQVPYIHASPSKLGTNTIYAEPGVCPGEIGDFVWKDLDADGFQDPGEPGIDGVQVRLYKDNGDGVFNPATDILMGTRTTSAGGKYLFQDLEPNDYFVDVVDSTVPAGYQTTTYNDPTDMISLGEGERYLDADFGYVIGALLGDFVWEDLDKDGIQDPGEPGIPGVTVNLYDGAGNLIAATVTDSTGFYGFANRPAGSYQLEFIPPYGFVFSPQDQGGNDAKDSDANPLTGRTVVFTMASGVPDLTRDAGLYHQPGVCDESTQIVSNFNSNTIPGGSVIWFNSHLDTITGLPAGQPVTLFFDQGRIQFTANSVNYDLPVPRAKIIFSPTAASSSTVFDAATQTWVTTVAPGDIAKDPFVAGLAFPVPAGGLPANINPVTWSGRFTTDTPGVTLSWQWSAAVYLTFSTDYNALGVTPVDGAYQSGTPESYRTYVVAGARGAGAPNYTGTDTPATNTTPCEMAKIGDRVWNDANNNGIQDPGELGLPNVTVKLYDDGNNLIASAVTNANGLYLFTVPPGNYYLHFTLLPTYTFSPPHQGGDEARDSDPDPVTGKTPVTNLYYGENDITWDAGMSQTASVGDRVWYDANYNGIQDTNEPGVPDIAVMLFDANGNFIGADTTDANGIYGFTGLTPGTYYLAFSIPAGYVVTAQNQGGDPARDSDPNSAGDTPFFTLAAGQNDPTRDAGIYPVSSLGDRVWYDADADGIQDPNEAGAANVTVELYSAGGSLIDATITDSNGNYLFDLLQPGDYIVRFVRPAGAAFTRRDQGLDNAVDSDADAATGKTTTITLPPGQDDLTWDAGLVPAGAIGDFVWYDANKDGIQDVGEPGIANVTLDLYLDGVLIATTTTDADGGYLFPALPPGNYTVDVTDQWGRLDGLIQIAGNQARTDPVDVVLELGQIYKDADFGYVRDLPPGDALIGDTVWYDGNGDGIQQPSEPGIPGVTVCATPAGGGAPICDVTDSNGIYQIVVPAGIYTVAPTNPPAGYTATTPSSQTVELSPGQQYLDADFGYTSPNLGRIGNLVFIDVNKNSIFDAGDYAAAGVSVDLIRDTNGNKEWDPGEPIIATVTTASKLTTDGSNGNYLFTGLPTGNYLVHVSDVNGVLIDFAKSPLGAPNIDNNNQADPYPVSLPQGATILTADFGYQDKDDGFGGPEGAIGNQVWIETDGDGLFDPLHGDFGQAGVTVELLKDNLPYRTTTTGASGRYAFLRLPDGNYRVSVNDLAEVLTGYVNTALGPNPGQDNNNQAQPYPITLPVDGVNWTADFGFTLPAAIGDYVWYDSNKDGIQDVFEPGLGNVTLSLYQDNGNGVLQIGTDKLIAVTVTSADGGYLFTDLTPGAYFVDVTDTMGMLGGLIHTLGPQSKPDPFGALLLSAGQIYRDADFGYVQQLGPNEAVIGDTVWYDGDGDGVRDPGEPSIPGVQVCATNISSGAQFCDVTNSSGIYLIKVPAGAYDVAPVNPPAGYNATTPVPHGPVTVGPGESYLDADFGYNSPVLGSIGGTIWRDTDEDGLLDPGEPRLPGVSVDLILDDGDGVREPGEPVIATVTTDQNGDYLFQGLPPGNYLVVVSDTQNVLDDYTPTVAGPNPGADNNNQEQPYLVTLAPGEVNTTADFGYVPERTDGELGIIGNQVWYEADGNGLYNPGDSDVGIAGVTVALYRGASLYDTTTTGAGGDYVFTSLPAGSYSVQVTDDFGVLRSYIKTVLGPNPGADNNHQAQPYAISLPPAGINMTADFGYTRPGAIGDFVWYDTNKNGVQDVGEPGIPNVTLDLYHNGIKIASTVTDADGGYLFPGLRPGNYTVDVTDVYGRLSGLTHLIVNQSLSDPTPVIRLAAGEVYKDADFGYVKFTPTGRAVIGDTVWYDENGDGIQQPGEPGIPGVTVCAVPTGGGAQACETTDSNGIYRIVVLAGSYNVAPTNPPANYTATTPVPHPVTVAAGDTYLNADFGYDSNTLLGRIGNLVFLDKDKNGIYGAGDAPLPGVSVSLIRDTNNNGAWDGGEPVIATVTTVGTVDANTGNYLFPGVPAGRYLVHVSDTNAVLTDYIKSPLGTPNVNNHNQADPYPVNLPAGGAILTADFGYYQAARPDVGVIGNQVWIEKDANGVFNPTGSDFGQAGVTVELYRYGELYDVTVSGASGDYSFVGLPAGAYTVTVSDDFSVLAAYVVTTLGPNPGLDNNNQAQPYSVALPTGGYNLTADFGYIAPKSSIGDTVFFDDDRSGTQNGVERGIQGILVQLYAQTQAGACQDLLDTRVTDANGKYLFANLAPGAYCVIVPENADNPFLATFQRTAGPNPHKVTLAPEQNYLDADFGYAGRGPILGIVYYDWNENGARDPAEAGIPNVQVCLFEDLDRNGVRDSDTAVACTTTGGNGNFSFPDQLPGSYVIEQTQPGGLSSTTPNVIQASLQLTEGQGYSDGNDFGEILKVRLGDLAWVDADGDGTQDTGEPGLSNVPIQITGTDIIGRPVNRTIFTSNGLYLADDLLPGTYTATAPTTFNGYNLNLANNSLTTTLTVTFTEDLTLDFPYSYPTSVQVQQFTARSANGQVLLSWTVLGSATEGFRVWRADNIKGLGAVLLTETPVMVGPNGEAQYTDADVTVGQTYWYWLEYVGDGTRIGPAAVTARAGETHHTFLPLIQSGR